VSEQLQLRRGTAAQISSSAAPAQGELWVDTTNNRVIVGDGTTVGGWPAAKLAEVLTNWRIGIGDANYTVLASDRLLAYTSLTAARVVSLLAANAYPVGTPLTIVDESGNCSATNTITINRNGTDLIDGVTSIALAAPYAFVTLQSNGVGKWTITGNPAGGATGVLAVAAGGSGVSAAKSLPFYLAALAVNANSVADTSIAVALPFGLTRYRVQRISCLNASIPLTTAQAAVYTSPSGGGVALASPQGLSGLTTSAPNNAGNAIDLTLALAQATYFAAPTLYFRITTAQGSAASVDVVIEIAPYD
jgi:hypothetical protein